MTQDIRVRIVSDPYRQNTSIYIWDGEWVRVDTSYDPESELVSDELVRGFFPFKAERIVELLRSEFGYGDDTITIVFEGSSDEYEELRGICDPLAPGVRLERSGRSLPNARDVLPSIRDVFNDIRPLIDESIFEQGEAPSDLEKFYDASADLVPICVLGNYSAGKSTFVNALIGKELLPSGAQPVTAKVFQITRSRQCDRAHIRFECGQQEIDLLFSESGLITDPMQADTVIYDRISLELASSRARNMIQDMNRTIALLNERRRSSDGEPISDLIRIEVPFSSADGWMQDSNYVIFDTPGYNAASNADHARVLKNAMEGFSNGLLVYVAELDSLDAQDNANLCREIRGFDAIDERFAMIVVNKADSAELPDEGFAEYQELDLMDEFIPRNLYAQGIYFVSSVVGLGAKNGGQFNSRNCLRVFHQQRNAYSDPDDLFYTTLYRYNMLPQQMRARAVAEAKGCQNILLANSGLYCVERELDRFATRYSAYNKCQQSLVLLRRLASSTKGVIEEKRQRREAVKRKREETLERDKRELINALEAKGREAHDEAFGKYQLHMEQEVGSEAWFVTYERLRDKEQTRIEENQKDLALADAERARNEAFKAIGGNLKERWSEASKSRDPGSFIDALASVADDVNAANESRREVEATRRIADQLASDQLLDQVIERFKRAHGAMAQEVNDLSIEYWADALENTRGTLFRLATGSTALSEERRREIGNIIINHPAIDFSRDVSEIFTRDQFEKNRLLRRFGIIGSERLDLRKLEGVYNTEINRAFSEIRESIGESHEDSFDRWQVELLSKIESNINDYNPDLKTQVDLILEDERQISKLTAKLRRIENCVDTVERLIGWRG